MNSYVEMADYYDLLMEDVDYNAWAAYIKSIFDKTGLKPKKILDAACGTGNITIPMAKMGYDMWGVDISEEMLTIAENKTRKEKLKIKLVHQDLADLNIKSHFDAVICACDGINYITEEEELSSFFDKVYQVLENNGMFVFDISSYFKLSITLGNHVLYQEKNNIHYIWDNNFNEEDQIIEMHLTFFAPEGGLFKKFEEFHIQKAYTEEQLTAMLKNNGFAIVGIFDAFSFDTTKPDSDRIFIVAQKTI